MSSFEENSTISNEIASVVIPYLYSKGKTGEFIRVEGNVDDDVKTKLDVCSGIDYLYKSDNKIYGVAFRGQYGTNWQTFTIRRDTEFPKRATTVFDSGLYPEITIQAYVDKTNNRVLSVCWADTKYIYNFIRHTKKYEERTNQQDGKKFFVVK